MAENNTAVATRETSEVGQFQAQLASRANEMAAVLPAHITPEKFQRTIVTAVANDPDLLKADRPSLILACYKAAQDGLLPDKREAALVVFNQSYKDGTVWKKRKLVQYMPMVYGLRKKILQSNEVVALEVGVVYRRELDENRFYYNVGVEPPLGHKPSFDLTQADTSDDQIVAAYSIATMKDGTKSYEVMRRFEIDKVRECSQTGATRDRQGKPRNPSGPWVEWFPEQAKKTVMRRHSKVLPQSGDVMIDVEGQELERNMSSAAVLGSTKPDTPVAIEDQTGEHYTDDSDDTIDGTTGEVVDQGDGGQHDTNDTGDKNRDETVDDAGVTPDPAEAKADEVIQGFDKAELLADLRKLYKEVSPHLAFMPGHLAKGIDEAYDRNDKRLTAAADPAKAAEKQTADAK